MEKTMNHNMPNGRAIGIVSPQVPFLEFLEPRLLLAVLVQYDFTGEPGNQASTAADYVDAHMTATPVTRGTGVTAATGTNTMNSSAWTTSLSLNLSDYYSFGVWTVQSGYSMTLDYLYYADQSDYNGPYKYNLRYSRDGFATYTNRGTGDYTSTGVVHHKLYLINSGTEFQNLSGSIEFRLYGYDANTSSGKLNLQNNTIAYDPPVQITPNGLVLQGTITPVNSPPTDISLDTTGVPENQPAGTAVGTLSTVDPDAGNTFTYSLESGTGSTDNASFTISGSSLLTAAAFDYETKSSYSVRIRTTDQGGLWYEEPFTIGVTNVNETPTDIALSNSRVLENQPAGTVVGALSGTDPDAGQSATLAFTLVPGYGDNAQFSIDPATKQLKTAAMFDYETKNIYDIKVLATDAGSPVLTYDEVFAITVSIPTSEQWTGGTSGQWDDPANWALGLVPGPNTVAVFDGPVTRQPVLGQNQTVKGIDIRSAGWTIDVNGHTLILGSGGLSLPGGASPTAGLDLKDGRLVVNYEGDNPMPMLRDQIIAAFNSFGWDGNGIGSKKMTDDPFGSYSIGYADNSQLLLPYGPATEFTPANPFGDTTDVTPNAILVRYTLIGDVDLNGIVDDTDISLLTNSYLFTGQDWFLGDVYLYDGVVDDSDVGTQANNYLMTVGRLGGELAEVAGSGQTSAVASAPTVVDLLLASGGAQAFVAGQPASAEAEPVPDVLREAVVMAVRPAKAAGLAAAADGVFCLSGGAEPELIQLII
jgi:hypothetical protein